ncbi:MAG: TIGR04084 family radical SAM/SPASM domain-containing protein [Candidatus Thorarchaeota archaeon]|jgi:putative peptide-modifying radical SAM enzyme
MNYHLILTRQCNLNCVYCRGGEATDNTEIQYSLDDLADFLLRDRTHINLMLYGGEPTLRVPLMVEIMDRFPNARFMLQTNALLLDKIPEAYVKRMHSILVSIDGPSWITDGYRSDGVYDKVIQNVRWLEEIEYAGDVVARMAVSQDSDIFRDVTHLIERGDPSFDHVHWQLNVVWDADDNWVDFDNWVSEIYNPGINRLVSEWVRKMEGGVVQGIVPFMPLMYTLLTEDASKLRCGAGIDTFAIHVDGRIGICPISPDWDFSIVGDIWKSTPDSLQNVMSVDEPCPSCTNYTVCGGRCLFANKKRLWGQSGFDKVCGTVNHLIEELKYHSSKVYKLIQKGIISLSDLNYTEYNNGCEIIP